jgi:hypothetical protein
VVVFRSSFTDAEWQTILFTPLWAFHSVATVDGKIDKREVEALARELAEARLFRDELAREVLTALGTGLQSIMPAFVADTRGIVDGLQQAAGILDSKLPPGAADGFKRAVMLIAGNVARADGPVWGDKASKEEKTAIFVVAVALRVPVPAS